METSKEKLEKNILKSWDLVRDILTQKQVAKKLGRDADVDLREKEVKELRERIDEWETIIKSGDNSKIDNSAKESEEKLAEWKSRNFGFQYYML